MAAQPKGVGTPPHRLDRLQAALPGFGERHVPLLPYGYAALDRLWAHLYAGQRWPHGMPTPAARPRGTGALERSTLGLP